MSRKRIEKNLAYDDEKRLYYAYFDYGKDESGARVRRTQTFEERDRAKEALYRFEVEHLQYRRTTPTQMTVKDWLTYWLDEVIQPNRERTTYYCYQSIIKNHLIPELGSVRLQQLTPKQIQSYYTKMMRSKSLSPNTVHKHHILLHTALQTAFRQNLLTENPVDRVEAPHLQAPKQLYYNPQQLRKLFQLVEGSWLEVVVKLAGYLGLRRSEICGLKWKHIDFSENVIQIRFVRTTAGGQVVEKEPKTPHSVRTLSIAGLDDLVQTLLKQKRSQQMLALSSGGFKDSGYVITREDGLPRHPNQVTQAFHIMVQECGLPPITIHGLRHTFASVANFAKIPLLDIGKALGHKDVSITGRIYTHLFDQTHQEVVSAVAAQIKV
ncbi:site-specific integrase [Flavonifractor sp. An10]|uniref:tyrosine-type recombinase/integrase n=1 Tax=Flavonifractor sp. An10 TaxID=1965537 RepID=UPI000B3AAE46|nr:site-specific integrase [Flavonifractor sp. An10]OUQ82782.1 hypothetical protein B5E42_08855 [Flavonifractor sp. An10]